MYNYLFNRKYLDNYYFVNILSVFQFHNIKYVFFSKTYCNMNYLPIVVNENDDIYNFRSNK